MGVKYVYVLENESKLQKQIYEALRKSDPQIQIRFFSTFEDFKNWIPSAMKQGREALSIGGFRHSLDLNPIMPYQEDDELLLLISKDEWLGSRYMPLARKTQDLFIRRGLCAPEAPTRLVITAFESPTFDIKLVEDRIISNVLFKPFDELILQQHLNVALGGSKPASQNFVHKVQTKQQVEMTKEVQMEAVGDVGFVTRSPRPIQEGQVSKYYGEVFKSTGRIHVMGRCVACQLVEDGSGDFRVWFSYFGIPSRQILDIRKSMVKRNEVEFSANTPSKPRLNTQQNWFILDPKPERAEKIKKVLIDLMKAEVEILPNFESFEFQSDPMRYDSDRKEKPWGDLPEVKIVFDAKGEKPISIEPADATKKKVLGWAWDEFNKQDFSKRLHHSCVAAWKSLVQGQKIASNILLVQNNGVFFPIEVKNIAVSEKQVIAEFVEPSPASKMSWFRNHFPSPATAHGIVIGEEYLREDRLEYWNTFRDGKAIKFYSMHEKTPDEAQSRQLKWMDDLFEESNDSVYLRRKLSWIYGISLPNNESTTPFLNATKEVIRVANPVQVVELSEAGLVITYSRAMSLGSFRQFVLSNTAENFHEYLSVCYYTCEAPSEKEMFQNYFMFFGISDAYLKSIRLWILENYVTSKQQEGS